METLHSERESFKAHDDLGLIKELMRQILMRGVCYHDKEVMSMPVYICV